jgi:hypothetical protein
MKKYVVTALMLVGMVATFAAQKRATTDAQSVTKSQAGSSEEAQFRALEQKLFDVTGKTDLDGMEQLFDAEYFTVNHDASTGDKASTLSARRANPWKLDKVETSEFRMRHLAPEVVVVNGRSKYFMGGKMVGDVRHTEIWVKRSTEWKFAGWQGTPVPAEPDAKQAAVQNK